MNVRGGTVFGPGNHGTTILRVRNSPDLGEARKLYLRFDLAGLPDTAKAATGVAIALHALPVEGNSPDDKVWTFQVSGLKDGLPEEDWDETKVNWNAAPASVIASPVELTDDAVALGTFSIPGKGQPDAKVTFSSPDLLKFVQSDTDGAITLIITRQTPQQGADDNVTHVFASKESNPTTPPVLSVAFGGENALAAIGQPAAPPPVAPIRFPTEPVAANANAAQEINAFWEADKKQMPPMGAVLFMGSSSIRMWDTLAKDFSEIPVINRGFGGSLIQESTQYADRIALPYKPKIIVLAAGTNDLAYGNKKPPQVLQDFKNFEAKIHAALPDTRIIYISINPTVQRWNQEADILETNHLIEKWIFQNGSKTRKMNFIDSHSPILTPDGQPQPKLLQEDGLHFNAEGYKMWKSILKPRIIALAAMDGVASLDEPKTP